MLLQSRSEPVMDSSLGPYLFVARCSLVRQRLHRLPKRGEGYASLQKQNVSKSGGRVGKAHIVP